MSGSASAQVTKPIRVMTSFAHRSRRATMIELALELPLHPAEQFPAWTRRCRVHDSSYGRPPTAGQEYCHRRRRLRPAGSEAGGSGALLYGGRDARVGGLPVAAAGSGWSETEPQPSLRSTEKNHSADAPVPTTTSAAVAAVESIRNILAGSVTIQP
jgi:hypothetical protein